MKKFKLQFCLKQSKIQKNNFYFYLFSNKLNSEDPIKFPLLHYINYNSQLTLKTVFYFYPIDLLPCKGIFLIFFLLDCPILFAKVLLSFFTFRMTNKIFFWCTLLLWCLGHTECTLASP